MNKAIIGLIIALLVGSGIFIIVSSTEEEVMSTKDTSVTMESNVAAEQPNDVAQESQAEETSTRSGEYIEYNDTAIADSSGTKRVLFFHAEWCSTCKFYEREIEAAGVPDGITIIEADYESEADLKAQYGVDIQSTFVLLDDNENVIQSWPFASGLRGAEDLFAKVLET